MSHSDLCRSFPPSVLHQATTLIVGSMPGERSLREGEYYAHPHNIFWDIMGDVFGAGRTTAYRKRLRVLQQNRVALWDVACQCRRRGSLDAAINMTSVIPNDFRSLFARCPRIQTVLFNGHKAEQLFRKLVWNDLVEYLGDRAQLLRLQRLPSTSPAHASLTRRQKTARWRRALRRTHYA